MVGTNNSDDMSAYQPSARTASNNNNNTDGATEPQHMFVQLRPGTQLLRKCLTHLEQTIAKHPDADMAIVGYDRDDHQYLLTLAVNLGPRDQIAKFSEEAVTGYNFVSAVFTEMFDYLPQYTSAPNDIERENAEQLNSLVADANAETSTETGHGSAAAL